MTYFLQGPVSVAVYAPGADFKETIDVILYLRNCIADENIKNFVTFHVFYHTKHVPKEVGKQQLCPYKLAWALCFLTC